MSQLVHFQLILPLASTIIFALSHKHTYPVKVCNTCMFISGNANLDPNLMANVVLPFVPH